MGNLLHEDRIRVKSLSDLVGLWMGERSAYQAKQHKLYIYDNWWLKDAVLHSCLKKKKTNKTDSLNQSFTTVGVY